MNHDSQVPERICYSFSPESFELDRMRRDLWKECSDSGVRMVQLDPRWKQWLPRLRDLDLLMACAADGPVSIAAPLAPAAFTALPEGDLWVCPESHIELDVSALTQAALVLEPAGGLTLASLQLFGPAGQGALKILLTQGSNLEALHELVHDHAQRFRCLQHPSVDRMGGSGLVLPVVDLPVADTESVRALWDGSRKTLPDQSFPGLPGVTRLEALRAAGEDLAQQVDPGAPLRIAKEMARCEGVLGVVLRTRASFLPVGLAPMNWRDCGCGVTFTSPCAQLTLKHSIGAGEAWLTRFGSGSATVNCLEIYDEEGRFCAGLGLHPDSGAMAQRLWDGHCAVAAEMD